MQTRLRRSVRLRRATAADAAALFLLRYEAFLPQYGAYGSPDCPCVQSEEQYRQRIRRGDTYAIEVGDQLAGGLTLRQGDEAGELEEIYVQPQFQQMGVGQMALMHAEQRCPAVRYRARVISGEAAAMGLLRKMGYRPTPALERPADRITLVTMEKNSSSMVTLLLEPLRREDLGLAVEWIDGDPDADLYRPLWMRGRQDRLTMAEFAKEFAFGKHYIGAPQMDYAIRTAEFGVVIGMASLTKLDWEGGRCSLDYLVLDPKWRASKLGQRAVEQLCRLAQEQYGFGTVSLTVLEDNARAIGCFLRSGFTEAARRQNVMRGGEDQPRTRIVMMRAAKE